MAPSAIPVPEEPSSPITDLTKAGLLHSNFNGNGPVKTSSPYSTFLASSLVRTLTTAPRPVPASLEAAVAGSDTVCTDHMITVKWSAAAGWAAPQLRPYGPLSLMPTASVLHYATECFEGLKAYRGYDGRLRLFRPDCNARRMLGSAQRISLPGFDPRELERLLVELLAVDGPKWLPRDDGWRGSFLYVRPTMIGTAAELGVSPPREALLFIVLGYLPRLDSSPGGLRLHTSPHDTVRAWEGGCGHAKVGANYGPTLLATGEARRKGYHQVLWLYGKEGYCTEAGASNMFVVMRKKGSSEIEVVTAPLNDRLILDGITRRSVLEMLGARMPGVTVSERRYTIDEVLEARQEGRLVEAFAAGTAYFICPISTIHHRGRDIDIPMGKDGKIGEVSAQAKKWIGDIMYGGEDHEWGVVIPEDEEQE